MEHGKFFEANDKNFQGEDSYSPPIILYNKDAKKFEKTMFWDDDGDAVKNAQFTFIWVIVFVIGLYLVYNLYAFLERCRHKVRRRPFSMNPWRLLRPSMSSASAETQVEGDDVPISSTIPRRERMTEHGENVAEFMFPPVHLAKARGLIHLQPSPMHLPPDKRNPDAEEIIVFLPMFPISPPTSSLDLSNTDGERELSSNITLESGRHTV